MRLFTSEMSSFDKQIESRPLGLSQLLGMNDTSKFINFVSVKCNELAGDFGCSACLELDVVLGCGWCEADKGCKTRSQCEVSKSDSVFLFKSRRFSQSVLVTTSDVSLSSPFLPHCRFLFRRAVLFTQTRLLSFDVDVVVE